MTKILLAVGVLLFLATMSIRFAVADPAPQRASQPHSDQFMYNGGSLDAYNPLSEHIRSTGEFRWAYERVAGCSDVGMSQAIEWAMDNVYQEVGVQGGYAGPGTPKDLTIRTNCGTGFAAVCGSGAAACLGRGFPYVLDIDFSSDVGTYYDVSKMSVVLHELFGHALATINEQYCLGTDVGKISGCTSWGSPVPAWVDVMNTGVNSRHFIADIELERWGRVNGAGAPASYGVNLRDGYFWFCGLPDDRATGVWIADQGTTYFADLTPVWDSQRGNCYGVARDPKLGGHLCFDVGNAVDWKSPLTRSDRCF